MEHIGVTVIVRGTQKRASRALAMAMDCARFCGSKGTISQLQPGAVPTLAVTINHAAGGGEALAEFGTSIRTVTDGAQKLAVKQWIAKSDHDDAPRCRSIC